MKSNWIILSIFATFILLTANLPQPYILLIYKSFICVHIIIVSDAADCSCIIVLYSSIVLLYCMRFRSCTVQVMRE